MIRSDYRPVATRHARPSRPAPPRLDASRSSGARRELATLRTLMPRADGRGPPRRARSAARPGSGKSRLVREFAARGGRRTARSSSTAPATPSCARRTGRSSRRSTSSRGPPTPTSCAPRSAPAAASSTRLLPDLPARVGELPPPVEADPDTERHRLHTAVDRPARRRQPAPAGCCSCSRTGTGPTRRRCCSCATSRARPGDARVLVLATFRDTEADVPERAVGDARRPAPRPTTSSGCGSAGSRGDEVAEFVRRAAGRRARRRSCASWPRRSTTSPRATRSWSASCGARSSRPAPSSSTTARSGSRGRRRSSATPESVREVVSQRLARLDAGDARTCSSWPRRPARSSSSTSSAARPGSDEPRAARRARRGGPQRHDRGAARRRGSPTASRTSSCAGRCTTGCRGCGGRSCTCASARRSRRRRGRSGRALADLAHHFAAAAPLGGPERARRVQPAAPPGRPTAALAFDEAAARLRTALELGIDGSSERAEVAARARARAATAPARRSTRWTAFRAAAEIARELGDARAARAGGDRLRGRLLAARRSPTRARSSCSRRRRRRSATTTRSCASGCSAGLARALDFQGDHERGAVVRDERDRDGAAARRPRRARHRADALVLVARREPARGDPRDADRGARPRRGARQHRDPGRGDGLARADVRRARRPRGRAARGRPRCARRPSRPRSRSCSTSPSTTARRSRSATGASTRPRRWPTARTSGAGC